MAHHADPSRTAPARRGAFGRRAILALGALLASGTTPALAQPASLVADIAQGTPLSTGFFDFVPFASPVVTLGGSAYFGADDQIHGRELWVTDGTAAGTHLVADLCPGSCSGVGVGLQAWNGGIYFWGTDGDHAEGFRRTDAATAASVALVESFPQGAGSLAFGSSLYFVARDAAHGYELWRTNGSVAGTALFKDIVPGTGDSYPALLAATPSFLYFAVQSGTAATLWRTDGTDAGTIPLPGPVPSTRDSEGAALPDGTFVFASTSSLGQRELWHTDGTPAGTSVVASFGSSATLTAFTPAAGSVIFSSGGELWTTDGSPGGTVSLATLPNGGTFAGNRMTAAGGFLYFAASSSLSGLELWRTTAPGPGVTLVKEIGPGSADGLPAFDAVYRRAPGFPLADGRLLFYASDAAHGTEPWVTDGTDAGTTLLQDLAPGTASSADVLATPALLGGKIVFRAYDLPGPSKIWQTNGTTVAMLAQPNQQTSSLTYPFAPTFSGATQGAVFAADDHVHAMQAWVADGLGSAHAIGDLSPFQVTPTGATVDGRTLLFADAPNEPGSPRQLLSSDGSDLVSLATVTNGGYFGSFIPFLGDQFYAASTLTGPSLWRTDGSVAGTTQVAAWPTFQSASPFRAGPFLWIQLYQSASNSAAFWRSDGSPAGTQPALTLPAGVNCIGPQQDGGFVVVVNTYGPSSSSAAVSRVAPNGAVTPLTTFPHSVYQCQQIDESLVLFADDGVHGIEPWITDGTQAGTHLVLDVMPGAGSSFDPAGFAPVLTFARQMLFGADDGVHGNEPWITDGTPAGTQLLQDVAAGNASSRLRDPFAVDRRAFFTADDQVHGREVWTTDGTPGGTHLVQDTNAGAASSVPQSFATADGLLLFSATDGTHGRELFASDGSPGGTKLVQNIAPAAESSSPTGLAAIGPNVFFYADDATHGFEPWQVSRRALANLSPAALDFYTTTPCRLVDTRDTAPLVAGTPRTIAVVGQCGIPASAQAVSINVTTLEATQPGSLALYPADDAGPGPDLFPVAAGRTRATNAVLRVSLDDLGTLTALAELPTGAQMQLIVDVNGYFAP